MKQALCCCAALVLLAACAAPQVAPEPQATAAETGIVTDTGRWETEGSRDTLVRLKGPVSGWTAGRR